MESLLLALPALGCVLMIPLMMWVMGRMSRDNAGQEPPQATQPPRSEELSQLRDEVARLRSQVDPQPRSPGSTGG